MKWHRFKKPKKRKLKQVKGGLEKLKAEQGRLIFLLSTGNRIITMLFTYFYRDANAGIDSS